MNTARGSARRSRLIKMAAAVGAGLITAGLAAAKPVPAHDPTIDQAPAVTTTATADEPMLRDGGRDATPQRTGGQGDAPRPGDHGGPPVRAEDQHGRPGRPALSAQHHLSRALPTA